MALETYRARRNFRRTPEPAGIAAKGANTRLRYLIQRHAARRLHYDFRLELDGVLLSWAVPKGPDPTPGSKRLAVHVEDHPVAYGDFEGTIPSGEYGAGTVQLWDQGWWQPVGDARDGYRRGKLKFVLHGQRLQGHWALVRMHGRGARDGDNWLLVKEAEDPGGTAPDAADRSVVSNRSMDDITANRPGRRRRVAGTGAKAGAVDSADEPAGPRVIRKRGPGTHSRTPAPFESDAPAPAPSGPTPSGPTATPPPALQPMLATLATRVPQGDDWLHEIKLDGYRLLAFVDGAAVRLVTRGGHDWTARLRPVARALGRAGLPPCVLDGELVVFDAGGVSRFGLLQQALRDDDPRHDGRGDVADLSYVAFDLPWCAGQNLQAQPLHARKARLAALLQQAGAGSAGVLRYGDHVAGQGAAFLEQACRHGLEGIIAKRADSPYRSGARTRDWLKLKCGARQEFVIGGYTAPQGSREGFGALLLGYYAAENDAGLSYAGRVGTGFDAATLRSLHTRLKALHRKTSPFARLSATERRGVRFVAPELVAEVAFTEWTADGHLRHPSFLGLRQDKPAREVRRERAAPPPDVPPPDAPPASGRRTGAPARASANTAPVVTPTRRRTPTPAADAPTAPARTAHARAARVAGVALTHPDRVLYPEQGITKQALAEFYVAVAPYALPHLTDRPLSLVRCPQGRARACFFQKHLGPGAPDALLPVQVPQDDGTDTYAMVRKAAGLAALVQIGVLEIHPWASRADKLGRPDRLILDLDPAPDVPFDRVKQAALEVRAVLADRGLQSFVKTTGGKGLHLVAPIARRVDWDTLKTFARAIAQDMERARPRDYIATASKARRAGRIFVDWLRNARGATAVAPYSTRARPGAPVATPITWKELNTLPSADHFTVANFAARLKQVEKKNPWAGFFEVRQTIRN